MLRSPRIYAWGVVTELYNVQHLQSNHIDPVARVCITTIQRLYSILCGEPELDPSLEEQSLFELDASLRNQQPGEVSVTLLEGIS